MTASGSAPHHDRVLVVVLVMPAGDRDPDVQIVRVPPNTPHAEAFWHGLGRPAEGPEGTREAPADDECVQKACPTGRVAACGRLLVGQGGDTWDPICVLDAGHPGPCVDLFDRQRAKRRERQRADLIERLGPLPEPIPEEGP